MDLPKYSLGATTTGGDIYAYITSMCELSDGSIATTAWDGRTGSLQIWNCREGTWELMQTTIGSFNIVYPLEDRRLFTGSIPGPGAKLQFWSSPGDGEEWSCIQTLSPERASAVCLLPDGRMVTAFDRPGGEGIRREFIRRRYRLPKASNVIKVWENNEDTWRCTHTSEDVYSFEIQSLCALGPNRLLYGDRDGITQIRFNRGSWDVVNDMRNRTFRGTRYIHVLDKDLVASSDGFDVRVSFFPDGGSPRCLRILKGTSMIRGLQVLPHSGRIVSGTSRGELHVWERVGASYTKWTREIVRGACREGLTALIARKDDRIVCGGWRGRLSEFVPDVWSRVRALVLWRHVRRAEMMAKLMKRRRRRRSGVEC
jgi:WD40 repeat protein